MIAKILSVVCAMANIIMSMLTVCNHLQLALQSRQNDSNRDVVTPDTLIPDRRVRLREVCSQRDDGREDDPQNKIGMKSPDASRVRALEIRRK